MMEAVARATRIASQAMYVARSQIQQTARGGRRHRGGVRSSAKASIRKNDRKTRQENQTPDRKDPGAVGSGGEQRSMHAAVLSRDEAGAYPIRHSPGRSKA